HQRPIELPRQLGIVRPALGGPDRAGRERHEAVRHAVSAEPLARFAPVSLGKPEPDLRPRPCAGLAETKEPLRLVARVRAPDAAGVVTTSTGPKRAARRLRSPVVSTTSPRNAVWITNVSEERGASRFALRSSLILPARPPRRLLAESPPPPPASSASSPPSASRGASASG